MMRRSFRLGLWAGLLFGIAFAVVKAMQARRLSPEATMPSRDPWPPVVPPRSEPVATQEAVPKPEPEPAPQAQPEPEPPAPEPPSPEPAPAPEPVAKAAKKARPLKPPSIDAPTEPAPAARKATKRAAKKAAPPPAEPTPVVHWIEPTSPDMCPDSHPIKAKLSSKIFQLPGMFAYNRTRPDRCYDNEESAVADGLTKAKR